MRLPVILYITGVLVRLFAATFLPAVLIAVVYREWADLAGFLAALVLTFASGAGLLRVAGAAAGRASEHMRRVEGLACVAVTWLLVAHLAAVPYAFAGLGLIDALFEAMSGLTTTGATIFVDFSAYGRSIYFWRAMTQWIGGMGVIALFVAVLPRLAIGGRELFFAEAPGPEEEKLTPQLRHTALALWQVYAGLTVLQVLALVMAGMSVFDAACHAMTTLAAGGFSPHPLSIAGYQSATVEWIIVAFMFVAGANFALQYRALRGNRTALFKDEEFRAYTAVVLVATAALALFLVRDGLAPWEALRHGVFQVVSILTTTGYASTDFQLWSDQAKMVLFLLMFIGGCAGSAGGGPKVVRHVLMARYTLRELTRTLHPRAVLPVKLGGRVVPEPILRSVQVFMLFYLLSFSVGVAIVVALGADLITGITATIACLGNIGPGFDAVGPMANFAGLHPVSKVVLTLLMWIGRLEVLTVLVFFRTEPWRSARWSAT
ncbi:MAG: TrkH family potassium uptake protein [Acidobacteria bacterium]|nr:TrkH family potassium uptake protein [Acidobacteriota bacterium]